MIHAFLSLQKSWTHRTITSGIRLFRSLSRRGPVATLLYAPLTSKETRDRLFLPLHASKIATWRKESTCIVNFCFLTPK